MKGVITELGYFGFDMHSFVRPVHYTLNFERENTPPPFFHLYPLLSIIINLAIYYLPMNQESTASVTV